MQEISTENKRLKRNDRKIEISDVVNDPQLSTIIGLGSGTYIIRCINSMYPSSWNEKCIASCQIYSRAFVNGIAEKYVRLFAR